MKILEAKNARSIDNPHGVDARKLYDTENALLVHMTIPPGDSLKRHITPVDVFFFVLSGRGIVEIGDEKREIGADTLVESPAKIVHCWYNESDEPLVVLVGKVPKPTESTRIL